MRKTITIIFIFLLTFLLSGCQEQAEPESETYLPAEYMIEADNYFDYQTGLECAAFASAYLLRHYGEDSEGMELYKNFPSKLPEGGVMPEGIVTIFQERGYEAQFVSDGSVEALKAELTKGAPVIVVIHVEEPYTSTHNTHYIPVVGYDGEYFYFAESLRDYANCEDEKGLCYNRKTEIAKFERLWSNIDGTWNHPYYLISIKQ